MDSIRTHFLEAQQILEAFVGDEGAMRAVERGASLMAEALQNGGKIISCGNGGSMCDAMHFAEELVGRFRDNRRALPATAISDPSYLTCVGNDYGYADVFSRYVEAFGRRGDVLLGISTSGNSGNVVKAAETARERGLTVIGLTGKSGGKLAELCTVEVRAPQSPYADRAQEIHIKVIHTFIDYIETALELK